MKECKCPNCGAGISIDENKEVNKCQYCKNNKNGKDCCYKQSFLNKKFINVFSFHQTTMNLF